MAQDKRKLTNLDCNIKQGRAYRYCERVSWRQRETERAKVPVGESLKSVSRLGSFRQSFLCLFLCTHHLQSAAGNFCFLFLLTSFQYSLHTYKHTPAL